MNENEKGPGDWISKESVQQKTEEMYHNAIGDNNSKKECAFPEPTDPKGWKAMMFLKLIGPWAEISALSWS